MIEWNSEWGNEGELGTHRSFIYNPRAISNTTDLQLGDVISFLYQTKGETRSIPRLVFVMHPNFDKKCHALTLKNIDRDSILRYIAPRIRTGLEDPSIFYETIYKPSQLYLSDAYRTYSIDKMKGLTQFKYSIPEPGSDGEKTEKFFKENPAKYLEIDRRVVYSLFKSGFGKDAVKEYYDSIVKKRPSNH